MHSQVTMSHCRMVESAEPVTAVVPQNATALMYPE
jgi:hypothetical protein